MSARHEATGTDELWQLAIRESPVGLGVVGLNGVFRAANRSLCQMLGYSEEALRGMSLVQLTHPHDVESDAALAGQLVAGSQSKLRLTKRYIRADDSIVWGDVSVSLVRADDGTSTYFLLHVVDVTEQHHDQKQLDAAVGIIEHQRRRAEAIFDAVGVGLVLINRDGHYEQMNRRHRYFMALAFPEGHHDQAGQLGRVFAPDGVTELSPDEMPSTRAVSGEQFDDCRIWVGDDPLTRRALSVSARTVLDESGSLDGAALAYSDITDLMRALESREDFITTVSHELRTPLTSVLACVEMLLSTEDLDQDIVRTLELVQRNAERLGHLVADLLATAQRRQGKLTLSRSMTDLAELVEEALNSALPAAMGSGIDLQYDAPEPVMALIDHARLRQVLDNVIGNGLKYTDAGGHVRVSLRSRGHEADITAFEATRPSFKPATL